MSTNKDLANQLAAMRLKAKQATETPPPAPKPETIMPAEPESKEPPTQKKNAANRKTKTKPPKQGRAGEPQKVAALERTTITLKSGDTEALSDLQAFLMKRVRKAASTSTLIRLALFYTKQALSSDAESLAKVYRQILEEDGRRKTAIV